MQGIKTYLLTGLGGDERLFQYLDLRGLNTEYLAYDKPLPGDSLESYAARLARRIDDSQPFILMGISLGGIMATEIAKHKRPRRTVLISSAKTCKEFPPSFAFFRSLRLAEIIKSGILKKATLWKAIFGKMNDDHLALLRAMLDTADNAWIDWAKNAVLHWKNDAPPPGFLHIHGSSDHVFPSTYVKDAFIITGGTHIMVITRAAEVSAILRRELGLG